MSTSIVTIFDRLLQTLCVAFHAPSALNCQTLAYGLVLCLGRPTVRNLLRATNQPVTKHESAYHRFFARAEWGLDVVARLLLCQIIIPVFVPDGPLHLAGDDTTCAKTGRKVAYAAKYRDAAGSHNGVTSWLWGHNWVVLCVIVVCPWNRLRKLHLPFMARLYRPAQECGQHRFRTKTQLLSAMLQRVREWVGERRIELSADGAFAKSGLVVALPEGTTLCSRLRKDAALYELPPERTGRRGRPKEKGARLPSLSEIGRATHFAHGRVVRYGREEEVLLHSFVCLWWAVSKQPVRVVMVRDPAGKETDDYFFTTNVARSAETVVEEYGGRWGVEEALRELKQSSGMDEVQSWSTRAVWRQVPFVIAIHVLVQVAGFLSLSEEAKQRGEVPPYHHLLTRLRLELWGERISPILTQDQKGEKILALLEQALQTAA